MNSDTDLNIVRSLSTNEKYNPPALPSSLGVRRQKLVLGLFCLFVAAVVIAEVLLLPADYQLLLILFAVHISLCFFPIFRSRPFDWFEPPVLAALLGLLGQYRVIYLILYRDFRTDFLSVPLERSIYLGTQVLALLIFARLCYYAGYYTSFGKRWSRRFPTPRDDWSWKRIRVALMLGLIVALFCVLVISWKAGGPISYFRNLGYWKVQTRLDGMETFRRGISVLPYLGVLWFAYYVTEGRQQLTIRKRLIFWTSLTGMFLISVWNGSRSVVIIPAIALVMVSHYLVKRLSVSRVIALAAAAVLFTNIFLEYRVLTGQFTRSVSNSTQGTSVLTDRSYKPMDVLNEAVEDRRSFDQLMYRVESTKIPDDLKWGQTYLYLFVTPIPRSVWAGKKEFSDQVSAEVIPFMPPGFFGELYANFFIPGIMIGYFIWGAIQNASYSWLKRNQANKSVVFIYILFTLLIQEPSMNGLVGGLPIVMLFIICLGFIVPVRERNPIKVFARQIKPQPFSSKA